MEPKQTNHMLIIDLKGLKALLSFELFFVLFIFAGLYKADARLAWVPVDLTAFFLCLSIVSGLWILTKSKFAIKKKSWMIVLLYIAFAAWALISLLWTPGRIYAETKTLYICTLVLWSLAAPALIISTDPRRLKRLAVIFACLSFVVAIEAFTGYLTSGPNSFIYVYGSNYLGLGRVIGLSLILVIVYFLFWSNILHERIFAILLALFYLWILLVGGGRGPLLAALFAALIPLLFSIGVSEGKLKIRRFSIPIFTLIILCIAILGYLNETGQMTLTLNRLTVLQEAGMGKSAGARMEYYIYSFDLWKHSTLFGHGIGSWPIISGLGDIRNYPHNIMLEILVELGLIGFIIFGILIWAAFSLLRPINRIAYEPIKMLLIMLTVFMLFNAMLSGDISDNRLLFACIGLMPAAQFINRNVERI